MPDHSDTDGDLNFILSGKVQLVWSGNKEEQIKASSVIVGLCFASIKARLPEYGLYRFRG